MEEIEHLYRFYAGHCNRAGKFLVPSHISLKLFAGYEACWPGENSTESRRLHNSSDDADDILRYNFKLSAGGNRRRDDRY